MTLSSTLKALLLPLRAAPLLLIVLFSALLTVAVKVPIAGIPLGFLISSWFLKYGVAFLDQIAIGAPEPPVLTVTMLNPLGEGRSLLILVVVVAVLFLSGAASYLAGPVPATAFAVASVAVLTVILAILGATGKVARAVNPRLWLELIRILRGDYVLLVAFALAFAAADYALLRAILKHQVPVFAGIAGMLYSWLAIQSLLGRVLLHRRNELGLEGPLHAAEALDVDRRTRDREELLDAIYAHRRAGQPQAAWQTVAAALEHSADPHAELLWLYESVSTWDEPQLAARVAQELLPKSLAAGYSGQALKIVRQRLAADPRFRPRSRADLIQLVEVAREAGDADTEKTLLQDFQQFFPDDPGS